LADEGADIIAVDILENYASVPYAMASQSDLDETAEQVTALGRQIVTSKVDVRDAASLGVALRQGVRELGVLPTDLVDAEIPQMK
jgi:hypothetical protein